MWLKFSNKTDITIQLTLFLTLVFALPLDASAQAAKPQDVVKKFYTFYLNGFPEVKGHRSTYSKYVTTRFLRQVEREDDYDHFLDAQDLDETFKDNFVAAPAIMKG